MVGLYSMCERNPDKGLELIQSVVERDIQASDDPFLKFCRVVAYGTKGLLQDLRSKPWIDILVAGDREFREDLGLTEQKLDCLQLALQGIRKLEDCHPGFMRTVRTEDDMIAKIDGMTIALERCRPGRVQQILGRTKLLYFGTDRTYYNRHDSGVSELSRSGGIKPFMDVFFTCEEIVKAALVVSGDTDDAGRSRILVALYGEPQVFDEEGEQNPVADFVYLYDDGTYGGI